MLDIPDIIETHFPISLKSNFPSNPPTQALRVTKSFASGGCTSIKNLRRIYFMAKPPKCTSSKLIPVSLITLLNARYPHDAARPAKPVQSHIKRNYDHPRDHRPLPLSNPPYCCRASLPAKRSFLDCVWSSMMVSQTRISFRFDGNF